MTQHTIADADRELKTKHRKMWALGDYAAVATEIISDLGPTLVQAGGVGPGDRVLDVAAGSGNVAIPAALAGAQVVASDLTPDLLAAGQRLAARSGAELEWREADAEALPFADGEFDTVVSAVGVMFAPHHQAAADELTRVCRHGGTIALANWTPEGFIGQMFATMKPYAPPPPPGAQPPPLWGNEDHVRGLLGDRVRDVVTIRQSLRVDDFSDRSTFREYFKSHYGPTIAVYQSLANDPDRVAALDQALDDVADRFRDTNGRMEWEYLLLTARRT
ncbi:class I SAM-dependent methyltransferase [Nocardia sp. NPDC059180]|uniref:class I SAM-dependent methyltransferase n=1 Tax=Nocardia sp. NPDC059180 TaxID=3346761 RepID=UPI003694ED08